MLMIYPCEVYLGGHNSSCEFLIGWFGILDQSQMLFMRMFLRKHSWIPKDDLQYREIDDLDTALQTLVDRELIVDRKSCRAAR